MFWFSSVCGWAKTNARPNVTPDELVLWVAWPTHERDIDITPFNIIPNDLPDIVSISRVFNITEFS